MAAKKTETEPAAAKFPSRDEHGRVTSMIEFLGSAMGSTVATFALLIVVDLAFSSFDDGEFGHINGLISIALAAFLAVDDFKAWAGTRFRVPVFAASVLLATVTGIGVDRMLPATWLPLLAGALAALAAVIVYVVLWFTGIRLIGRED